MIGKSKVIVKEERLGCSYAKCISANACLWAGKEDDVKCQDVNG